MSSGDVIPDRQQREWAETTFDRNVVVVAGAGTGKTTLLINRLVHLLVKEPDPVPITRLVALTFTNKAATEMKVRLRERLSALSADEAHGSPRPDEGAVTAADLCRRYGLSAAALADRARTALREIEKAQIGTLHSFAAHVLRLHPLESGLDPAFQEDDGTRFEEHFAEAWDLWIDGELGREGTGHDAWRVILAQSNLDDIRSFARALCSELVDLAALHAQVGGGQRDGGAAPIDARLRAKLMDVCRSGRALLAAHARPKPRKVEQMLDAAVTRLASMAEQGAVEPDRLTPEQRGWLEKDLGPPVAGWEPAGFDQARKIIELAQTSLSVRDEYFNHLLSILSPLVARVRASFVAEGWISFDGLLARARTLLRDHAAVRERIKEEYRAILVDEFQDTDPVQYEIILAASERPASHAAAWQTMSLEPGKLCIVGDPKQSIYAFRRADIEAFDRVVAKIEADGGVTYTLTTNFRSDGAVLSPVNAIFDRLFERKAHVQPSNVRLDVRPQRRVGPVEPGVQVRLVRSPDGEPFDAEEAARAEAESVAQWLADDLLRRPGVHPGQVALLFRKLTQADLYVDALRRHGIPYLIDGEKHFYRRQEVIDLVNLLRLVDNPHDQVALTGLLRSPLGALTDREVYDLRQAGLFDYRDHTRLAVWNHPRAAHIQGLYRRLAEVGRLAATRPLAEVVERVFAALPVLELAAASLHGEQAVANLLKVKQTAASLSDRPSLTLSRFVELMIARLEEQPDEAESPLAEESAEAVHVLTIHKAKGLEFPVVVLPGLHQGTARSAQSPLVVYDWSSGLYGLSIGQRRTLGGVLLEATLEERERAERRRVLYVGMTRARDLLVLTGGLTARRSGDSVLGLLDALSGGKVGSEAERLLIGESAIAQRVQTSPRRKQPRRPQAESPEPLPHDDQAIVHRWHVRTEAWKRARETLRRLTPTGPPEGESAEYLVPPPAARRAVPDREAARLMGICAHRMLERWDFSTDARDLGREIAFAVDSLGEADRETHGGTIAEALIELFGAFVRSPAYVRLCQVEILGREVPFILPWNAGQIMEGVIDLIYRADGLLWVADYKTDSVEGDEVEAQVERYRAQGEIYREAVRRALGVDRVGLEFLFLRAGRAIRL